MMVWTSGIEDSWEQGELLTIKLCNLLADRRHYSECEKRLGSGG